MFYSMRWVVTEQKREWKIIDLMCVCRQTLTRRKIMPSKKKKESKKKVKNKKKRRKKEKKKKSHNLYFSRVPHKGSWDHSPL